MANKQRKSFFMPRLCRLSINDVVLKHIPKSSSTDPSSPKLSCIGRVKKRSTNNNNISISTTTSANNNNNNNNSNSSRFLVGTGNSNSNNNSSRFSTSSRFLTGTKSLFHSNRYTKLPNLFSKTLISPAIDTATMINNSNPKHVYMKKSKSCNGRRRSIPMNTKRYYKNSKDDHDIVRDVMMAGKLDPPLPVVKCGGRDPEVNGNLSKRRGIEIKSLQIQPTI